MCLLLIILSKTLYIECQALKNLGSHIASKYIILTQYLRKILNRILDNFP